MQKELLILLINKQCIWHLIYPSNVIQGKVQHTLGCHSEEALILKFVETFGSLAKN